MISSRLNAIVDMAPKTNVAADIGCDHGKVAVSLIKKGKAKSVICTDISEKSLSKARKLVAAKKLEGSITFRQGDGLSVLTDDEADIAIIAGMGGELIANMLSRGADVVPETLLLSCNSAAGYLRKWLSENGFMIEDEELVFEGRHFYPIMLVRKGQEELLTDMELELGPVLLKKKPRVLGYFLKRRIETAKEIRKKLKKANAENKDEMIADIDNRLKKYREVQKWLQQ